LSLMILCYFITTIVWQCHPFRGMGWRVLVPTAMVFLGDGIGEVWKILVPFFEVAASAGDGIHGSSDGEEVVDNAKVQIVNNTEANEKDENERRKTQQRYVMAVIGVSATLSIIEFLLGIEIDHRVVLAAYGIAMIAVINTAKDVNTAIKRIDERKRRANESKDTSEESEDTPDESVDEINDDD
jgi:hypothetical protein